MIKNKLYITAFLLVSHVIAEHTTLSPYAETLSDGRLSLETEKLIEDLFVQLNIQNKPHIRKTSERFLDLYPYTKHSTVLLKAYNCCYVDESFFNLLTPQERRADLAYTFYYHDSIQDLTKKKAQVSLISLGTQALLGTLVWKYIGKKYPNRSWKTKLPTAVLSMLPVEIIEYLYVQHIDMYGIHYIDTYVAQKGKCLEGLISYLKHIKNSDFDFFKPYREIINTRIAYLEKLKLTQRSVY